MLKSILVSILVLFSGSLSACAEPSGQDDAVKSSVIEIASFTLKEGVSFEEFAPIDKAVEVGHVSQQPGFLSRETATGENGRWVVIVHWKSLDAADASMASFKTAPAAAAFMEKLDASTMAMNRYKKN